MDNVSYTDAVESNERTNLDDFSLVHRSSLELLTKQIDKAVEHGVEKRVFFSDDQETLDEVYAKTASALLTLRALSDSLLKQVTQTYNIRSK